MPSHISVNTSVGRVTISAHQDLSSHAKIVQAVLGELATQGGARFLSRDGDWIDMPFHRPSVRMHYNNGDWVTPKFPQATKVVGNSIKWVAHDEVDRLRTLYDFYATPTELTSEPDHWRAALYAKALAYVWGILGKHELAQLHTRLAEQHHLLNVLTLA